ncbi:hypothetical protein D3C86_1595940 [compost metagenome]
MSASSMPGSASFSGRKGTSEARNIRVGGMAISILKEMAAARSNSRRSRLLLIISLMISDTGKPSKPGSVKFFHLPAGFSDKVIEGSFVFGRCIQVFPIRLRAQK